MPTSKAYIDFIQSLELAESLLKIESKYSDPAPEKSRKIVEGLRGGASVLMVAAFENYLKELIEEHFDELTRYPLRFNAANVPNEMLYSNMEYLVASTIKEKKDEKITKYNEMARVIVSGVLTPKSFTEAVRSNPDAKKLKEMFRRLGINDCYAIIKIDFDAEWGNPTAGTFISDYLDNVLTRRHKVAHTANMLNIARRDLHESIRFLKALGCVCDKHLEHHIDQILNPRTS